MLQWIKKKLIHFVLQQKETFTHKTNHSDENKDLLYVQHREPCSVLCGSLDGREFGENGYMYMYGLVPLLCTLNYYNIVNLQYKIKFKT